MLKQDSEYLALEMEALHTEFVPVLFAGDLEEARAYKRLLESVHIPVLLESERGTDKIYSVFATAIPVLVPEHMHDRASELVGRAQESGVVDFQAVEEDENELLEEDLDDEFEEDLDEDDLDDEFDDEDDEEFDEDFEDDDEGDVQDDDEEEEEDFD
jgi:hypothetical protein